MADSIPVFFLALFTRYQIRPPDATAHPVQRPHSTAPARAGAVRRASGPVPPPACADALAARRLRVPDLTPS